MHELVGALLPFSARVTIGDMVAVKALMGSTAGEMEDSEGEARQASDVYFIGSEACRRASGVIVGVFDVESASQSCWCSLQTMAYIFPMVW